jgi:hypothetical protein
LVFFVEKVLLGGLFEIFKHVNGIEVLPVFLFVFDNFAHMVTLIDKRNELFAILFSEFGFIDHFEDHFMFVKVFEQKSFDILERCSYTQDLEGLLTLFTENVCRFN